MLGGLLMLALTSEASAAPETLSPTEATVVSAVATVIGNGLLFADLEWDHISDVGWTVDPGGMSWASLVGVPIAILGPSAGRWVVAPGWDTLHTVRASLIGIAVAGALVFGGGHCEGGDCGANDREVAGYAAFNIAVGLHTMVSIVEVVYTPSAVRRRQQATTTIVPTASFGSTTSFGIAGTF